MMALFLGIVIFASAVVIPIHAVVSSVQADAAQTYKVTYNAAGGKGAPAPQIKQHGVPLVLSDQVPTRQGYIFLGWGQNTIVASYQPGDTYTYNRDLYLYAVWQVPASYIISYDANGGSGAPQGQTKIENEPLVLSSQIPKRTGYVFLGWSEDPDAAAPTYRAGSTFTENRGTTLYAVWLKNSGSGTGRTYRITYMANGGHLAPAAQTQKEGWAIQITSGTPRREGYRFLGWSENMHATTATLLAGDYYMPNRNVYLYAVWKKVADYIVQYDANGGTGAPEPQNKPYNGSIRLSSTEPTLSGWDFVGWATTPDASQAEYLPGSTYSKDASVVLYAVWQNEDYDFTIEKISVAPNPISQYGKVSITVRAVNLDANHSYTAVPIQLRLNYQLKSTKTVDFDAGGTVDVIFTLSVGALEGKQYLDALINWDNRSKEANPYNNMGFGEFDVEKRIQAAVTPIQPNGDYVAGNEVITSFLFSSTASILPDHDVRFDFEVYLLQGEAEIRILTQSESQIVVPAGGENLVWFRWQIPDGIEGTQLKCKGVLRGTGVEAEASFTMVIQSADTSQVPDTSFVGKAPEGYDGKIPAPEESAGSATWNQWEYIDGEFVLRQYGIEVSGSPELTSNSPSAVYADGVWEMKSGYGVSLIWAPTFSQLSGFLMPDEDAYTGIQAALAVFPEYAYSLAEGKYRVLECGEDGIRFAENPDAAGERIHFIPIYVADRDYIVSVAASQIWTPAGMIIAKRNCYVRIHGSVYDDFYIGLS